ncbi:MAG: hypothetical protein JSS14_25195 [Proteobacteria bacterium]|nr:hypothetical protein [Pseudomonadota bacterium]
MRESEAAKVHISTVKLLTRLLGAVATRPGIMADEKVRSDTLRGLHMRAMDLGGAIAQRCVPGAPVPDWLRAQAVDAAAGALCMAWEGGLSADSIANFNDSLAQQIGAIAQEGEAIAGRVGFDGYVAADSPETAQARLYVSITAAIGRITVLGFAPARAAESIGQVVEQLEASPNYADMKLDLRTAWLQGSVGRCTDLMIAVLESKALVTGGEDRLAFSQRQALSLIQEVETYAHSLIQSKYGHADAAHAHAEGSDPEPGSVPCAG